MSLICLYCPHTDKYYDAQGFIWEPDLSEHFSDLWERQLYRQRRMQIRQDPFFARHRLAQKRRRDTYGRLLTKHRLRVGVLLLGAAGLLWRGLERSLNRLRSLV